MVQFRRRKMKSSSSVRKIVNSVLAKRVEVKRILNSYSGSVTSSGTVIRLWPNKPIVGPDSNERIGNEVFSLSHTVKVLATLGDAGYNNMRYMVLRTYNPITLVQDLFDPVSFGLFTGQYAMLNYDVVQKTYVDKNITLNQQISGQKMSKFRTHYLKMKEKINWQNSTSNAQTNLYFVILSDSHPSSLIHPG
ncbi:MAG TPA: hypothetical protein EYO58_09760, partial [Flavobacteriales bacterium]|nr:hypothetical protein [Flavobacteriales bacterium]